MAKTWRSLVVGSVTISHLSFFLPNALSLTLCACNVNHRQSFVLVLVLVRSRSLSLSLSLSLRLLCGAASSRSRKVKNQWLWSCARGGCGLCLLGARLSSGNSLVSIHAFLVLCRDWVFQQYIT